MCYQLILRLALLNKGRQKEAKIYMCTVCGYSVVHDKVVKYYWLRVLQRIHLPCKAHDPAGLTLTKAQSRMGFG